MVTDECRKRPDLCHVYRVFSYRDFVFCSFVFRCYDPECRQISSHSSSSQIPGTCDLQACCFCGGLFVGIQCNLFFPCDIGLLEYCFRDFCPIGVSSLVVSAVIYYKIYLAVRRHRNQIQVLQIQQVEQDAEMVANLVRSRKSAVGTFYVFCVFLICYLPLFSSSFAAATSSSGSNTGRKIFSLSSRTVVFLNSSLNPVIYCWKVKHIRHAIMDILRSVFPSHN